MNQEQLDEEDEAVSKYYVSEENSLNESFQMYALANCEEHNEKEQTVAVCGCCKMGYVQVEQQPDVGKVQIKCQNQGCFDLQIQNGDKCDGH